MLYYRVKPEYDNKPRLKWSNRKRAYIPDSVWVGGELYTKSALMRNRYEATPEMFEEVRIKQTETYDFFGARFETGTTGTTKRETERKTKPRFNSPFIDDSAKMLDFLYLSKDEFLDSYSYLTEEEYNATVDAVLKLIYPNE